VGVTLTFAPRTGNERTSDAADYWSPFFVRADRNKLAQVVCNLVSNSLKFTPRGGRVTVEILRLPQEDESGDNTRSQGHPHRLSRASIIKLVAGVRNTIWNRSRRINPLASKVTGVDEDATAEGGRLAIRVTDTGAGISEVRVDRSTSAVKLTSVNVNTNALIAGESAAPL